MKKRTFLSEIDWLMLDWDWERNSLEGINPNNISTGSDKYAWWKCHICGNIEYKRCNNRFYGHGCTRCSAKTYGKLHAKQILKKNGSLADLFPKLSEEFHPTKNGTLKPNDLNKGSDKKVWWICNKGHEYQASVSHRVNGSGCPFCASKKVLIGFNDLQSVFPEIALEWHPQKNGATMPTEVFSKSNKKVWWCCATGHSYQSSPAHRALGNGCPYCAGKKALAGYNDLESQLPEIAKEWHYEKNYPLTPKEVTIGSSKKVWWKCKKCNYEWKTAIYVRKSCSCPACAHRVLNIGVNDLQTLHPSLALEWHPTRNGEVDPSSVIAGSNKKYWWKCKNGHKWQSSIYSRIEGCGCPECAKINRSVTKKLTTLKTVGALPKTHPDLVKEWNFEKNANILPEKITYGSTKKVWWKCSRGHEWTASINSRARGNGCPICSAEMSSSFPEQAILFYLSQHTEARSREMLLGREIDVYLPNLSIGIEYDGQYYHLGREKEDNEKTAHFKKYGIRIIRIKESSSNNIIEDVIYYIPKKDYSTLKYAILTLSKLLNIDLCDIDPVRDRFKIYNQFICQFKEKSLAKICPLVASEWDYNKNGTLTPETVSYGSQKVVWWKCKNGHNWQAPICSRTSKNGGHECGICAGRGPRSKKSDENKKIVLEALRRNPSLTYQNISDYTGLSMPIVSKSMSSLKNENIIFRVGTKMRGYWSINE